MAGTREGKYCQTFACISTPGKGSSTLPPTTTAGASRLDEVTERPDEAPGETAERSLEEEAHRSRSEQRRVISR